MTLLLEIDAAAGDDAAAACITSLVIDLLYDGVAVAEMEDFFTLHAGKITNIAFSGFGRESDSYPWHNDSMDVFLCQAISTIGLRVEGVNNDEKFDFAKL